MYSKTKSPSLIDNRYSSFINHLKAISKLISNGLFFSLFVVLFAWQPTARAQETNINGLFPIISFLLDDDGAVQCPSVPEVPVFTGDLGAFIVTDGSDDFSAGDLSEFLVGASPTGGGTTTTDIISADFLTGDSATQFFGDVVISTQEDINELEGIVQIIGSLSVDSASLFQELDFSPLASLVQVVGGVTLNTSNTNVMGFQCLAMVGADLTIVGNNSLTSIDGFQSLESIGFSLNIVDNNSLENISGFESLETIGNNLSLTDNLILENLGSLAQLNRTDIVGDIIITDNAAFDCTDPEPSFLAATFSEGNAANCTEDLLFSSFTISNTDSVLITDSGSITSTVQIPSVSNITGLVGSLLVNLDITHTSVGDLTVTLSNGATTINLLDQPSALVDEESALAAVASECIDEPVGDDFLNEIVIDDDGILQSFSNFNSIDAECALDVLSRFESQACNSNDIVVSLFDDALLPQINTSCSVDDLSSAFPEPSYFPLGPLSAFQGSDINETWTLTITDSVSGETGTLNSWGVVFDIEQ